MAKRSARRSENKDQRAYRRAFEKVEPSIGRSRRGNIVSTRTASSRGSESRRQSVRSTQGQSAGSREERSDVGALRREPPKKRLRMNLSAWTLAFCGIVLLVVLTAGFMLVRPALDIREANRSAAAAESSAIKLRQERKKAEDQLKIAKAKIAEKAKKRGYEFPGEESLPTESIEALGLPKGWPFDGFERALGAK